ncbi:hypothetical protein FBZ94_107154 [Bradyrhizobium sacchari]|uniref:Uncharacterized protein n=1 Tax=Bradyrhizobium sacchari TaxID=1399419 RepID=A0A560I9F7_9BRAD|nr:hypothetical protein FBZ94_107154 [Bradyrhizobium sacchari]TWB79053.1 hypothetical protein FBZ95_103905 [Bradyrhizobium sacchari]
MHMVPAPGRLASQWWGVTPRESTPERPIRRVVPLFPNRACLELKNQSCGMTWAQIAIIPTNSVMDASAAASSTKILNMVSLPC